MTATPIAAAGVNQAVPLLDVAASLAFYIDGRGCSIDQRWVVDGQIRWCSLKVGDALLMIQGPRIAAEARPGVGWSLCFMCDDAIAVWREARRRALEPRRPFVGNGLWVTSFADPDGYRRDFQSPTDAPEESECEGD